MIISVLSSRYPQVYPLSWGKVAGALCINGSSTAQQNSDKMTSDVLEHHLVSVVVIGAHRPKWSRQS